ncbi:hypothetical protein AAG570_010255 [Ranatra chinensis]|uniref:Uncharacterized protein n=1 Tax=Ranatra chinensis TaxID=642074 RepID=A0ABD0Z454_9HEMI
MTSKRGNMFYENKKQETTETVLIWRGDFVELYDEDFDAELGPEDFGVPTRISTPATKVFVLLTIPPMSIVRNGSKGLCEDLVGWTTWTSVVCSSQVHTEVQRTGKETHPYGRLGTWYRVRPCLALTSEKARESFDIAAEAGD